MGVYKYAPKWVYDSLPERVHDLAYVYGLRVIGAKQFRYVGSTVQPKLRLTGHGAAARQGTVSNPELQEWLQKNVGNIEMVILKQCLESEKLKNEKDTIRQMSSLGHSLFNIRRPTRNPTDYDKLTTNKIMLDRLNKILDS